MVTFEKLCSIVDKQLDTQLTKHMIDYKGLFNNVLFDEYSLLTFEYVSGCDLRVAVDAKIKTADFKYDDTIYLRISTVPYKLRNTTNVETYLELYFKRGNELYYIHNLNTSKQPDAQNVMFNISRDKDFAYYAKEELIFMSTSSRVKIFLNPDLSYKRFVLSNDESIIEKTIKQLDTEKVKIREAMKQPVSQRGIRRPVSKNDYK